MFWELFLSNIDRHICKFVLFILFILFYLVESDV